MGRPRTYTDALGQEICQRIADGQSLSRICQRSGMPSRRTVLRWVVNDENGFWRMYARARRLQAEGLFERILELAENVNSKTAHADRVRLDALKWALAKMHPERYGERSELHLSGEVKTPQPVDQAPEWLKAKVAEIQREKERKQEKRQPERLH